MDRVMDERVGFEFRSGLALGLGFRFGIGLESGLGLGL